MFTGLVEEVGRLIGRTPMGASERLRIGARRVLDGVARGDSICVSGACLTVEEFDADSFSVFASPETLERTSLGRRGPGDGLNLERSLTLSKPLGGHLVTGHVDAVGALRSRRLVDAAWEVWIDAPWDVLRLCVPKGSVAVDGISLTLVGVDDRGFSCWIIPETWERTTLSAREAGDPVNLESDLLAKYVFRCVETSGATAPAAARDNRLMDLLAGGGWMTGRGTPDAEGTR